MRAWLFFAFIVMFIALPQLKSAHPMVTEGMLKQLKSQYSPEAFRRGQAVNKLLEKLSGKSIKTKLTEINRYFNSFQYRTDIELWGHEDYWATPQEFIGMMQGDCEDYVIAKYFSLRKLGVPEKKLYLSYVKALEPNVAHMVLSYFETPSSIPLVLDSYYPYILPASKRSDLLPIYSFNASSLFLSNPSAGLGKSLPTDKIKNSKWAKLLADVKMEIQ
ncbi:MAG: transglutaminase [Gammaproteobacteria bacterium]|nr:transglutaminase [Gammaproteobacteria bacterium]